MNKRHMSVPGGAALVIFLLAAAAGLWLSRVPPSLPPRVVVALEIPAPAAEPVAVAQAPEPAPESSYQAPAEAPVVDGVPVVDAVNGPPPEPVVTASEESMPTAAIPDAVEDVVRDLPTAEPDVDATINVATVVATVAEAVTGEPEPEIPIEPEAAEPADAAVAEAVTGEPEPEIPIEPEAAEPADAAVADTALAPPEQPGDDDATAVETVDVTDLPSADDVASLQAAPEPEVEAPVPEAPEPEPETARPESELLSGPASTPDTVVPEPEPEPDMTASEPEPVPETVAPEPRPEPVIAAVEPEPEPEPETVVPEPPIVAEPAPLPAAPVAPIEADPTPSATWLAYARPFDHDETLPRIAVVVAGLGLGRAATAEAIKLPAGITLAFASHARDLQQWIDLARAAGHEVLLDLPMEPVDYPAIDPGPLPLLTTLSSAENVARLKWHLDRATGYVGVTHNMGSRFTASSDDLRPILSALKVRGLMFLDARTSANSVAAQMAASIGLPTAANDRFIDVQASRHAIDRRLGEVERIARASGFSIALGHPFPVTLDRLANWARAIDGKTFVLAPISALANRQDIR